MSIQPGTNPYDELGNRLSQISESVEVFNSLAEELAQLPVPGSVDHLGVLVEAEQVVNNALAPLVESDLRDAARRVVRIVHEKFGSAPEELQVAYEQQIAERSSALAQKTKAELGFGDEV